MGKLKHYRREEIDQYKITKVITNTLWHYPNLTNKELQEKIQSQIKIGRAKYFEILKLLKLICRIENKKGKYSLYNMSEKKIKAYRQMLLEIQDSEKEIVKLSDDPEKIDKGFSTSIKLLDLIKRLTWNEIHLDSEVDYHEKRELRKVIDMH